MVGLVNHSSSDMVLLRSDQERGDYHFFISAPRARPSTMVRRKETTAGSAGWVHECCTVLVVHRNMWNLNSLTLRLTGCKLVCHSDQTVKCEASSGFSVQTKSARSRELPWLIDIRDHD